mmetsp:Transcript_72328/g.182420  ORF Transcript_72328/g.182420 Transcript_72328/m.182420 type:complete len:226 (+) Transcript_72328:741-1418(+)
MRNDESETRDSLDTLVGRATEVMDIPEIRWNPIGAKGADGVHEKLQMRKARMEHLTNLLNLIQDPSSSLMVDHRDMSNALSAGVLQRLLHDLGRHGLIPWVARGHELDAQALAHLLLPLSVGPIAHDENLADSRDGAAQHRLQRHGPRPLHQDALVALSCAGLGHAQQALAHPLRHGQEVRIAASDVVRHVLLHGRRRRERARREEQRGPGGAGGPAPMAKWSHR